MGEDRKERERRCLECCQQECKDKCFQECCCRDCRPCDEGGNGIWLIILIVVIYLIFCNDNNGKGLFGGLF